MNESLEDKSNGYEAGARQFMASRNPQIGTHTVREWSRGITRGGAEHYLQILHTEGLLLVDEQSDEGGNHYYLASKLHLQIHHKDKIGTMAAR